LPVVPGVPETTAVSPEAVIARSGMLLEGIVHLYGDVPPVALNVCDHGTLTKDVTGVVGEVI
jgi:hypothetical protein